MTRTGLEPVLPPWKGGVLTAWPTGHKFFFTESKGFEPSKQFPVYTISNRAPSASRTTLQGKELYQLRK